MTKYEAMIAAMAAYVAEENATNLTYIPEEEKALNPERFDPKTFGVSMETIQMYVGHSGVALDVVELMRR